MSLKSVISPDETRITPAQIGYFKDRALVDAHEIVLKTFQMLTESGLTRAALARRLGKKPEQITRLLGAPRNMTVETLAELLAGMGHAPMFGAERLSELRQSNSSHPASDLSGQVILNRYSAAQSNASNVKASSDHSETRTSSYRVPLSRIDAASSRSSAITGAA